jgi:hypothetical protein
MLKPAAKLDWFVVDQETIRPIAVTPGIRVIADHIEIHRSHLPLLDNDDAARALSRIRASSDLIWEGRDLATEQLGFKLRNVQKTAVDFIRSRRGTLLGDDPRVGKGHLVGTKIMTPSGWQSIERLRFGDRVCGSDGFSCRVTGVFHRGVLPLYRVTFSDGASVLVDGDHRWTAYNHNAWLRGEAPKVKETRDLATCLFSKNGSKLKREWRIPLVKPLLLESRTLPIDPYLLGVLLGDGSFTQRCVTFTAGDLGVAREVERVLPNGTRLAKRQSNDRCPAWGIRGLVHKKNPVIDALRDLGLMGLHSYEKFVPGLYLFASELQRLGLLQGLMDTDGELHGNNKRFVGFSSTSKALVDAVRFLVESFGGIARLSVRATSSYTYKGEHKTGRPSYRLTISMPAGIKPFRSRQGYRDRPKFQPARHFASIEREGEGEVICISVDAPDQLYVTEHCIVTHNTLACAYSHDWSLGKLVVIAPLMVREVWLGWLRRVFPGQDIGIMTGRLFDPIEAAKPIVFGHYDILYGWQDGTQIGTLILDEAHMLTNRNSRRTRAAVFLASRAERVIAATGTPIWNMPPDLWSVLGLVAPGAFGSYHDFGNRYGAPEVTEYGTRFTGLSNDAELSLRLSEVMLRRRWVDVCDDLPPISRNVMIVDLDDRQRRKLDIAAESLRQGDRTNTAGALARYRDALSMAKLPAAIQEAERCLDRGDSVVIWTWHRELADSIVELLLAGGRQAFKLTGDTPMKNRDQVLSQWREGPAALVATMSVAQVGIDLSHAHRAIFAEIDYTPAMIAQAEMRTFAPTRPMNVTYVVADHFVDRKIIAALHRKLEAASPLGVSSGEGAIASIDAAFRGPEEIADMDRFLRDLLA